MPERIVSGILFFSQLPLMKLLPGWIALFLVIVASCTYPRNTDQEEIKALKQKLSTFKPHQALIKVMVGNQDFYPKQLPFNTNVQLLPRAVNFSFVNEEESNVEVELIREGWFEHKPVIFTLTNGTLGEVSRDQVILMIGKLIDKVALRGEGYFLVNGKIEIPELSHHAISIIFEGNLVRYGQASTVENYVPVKGWIVIKEPAFDDRSSAELVKRID